MYGLTNGCGVVRPVFSSFQPAVICLHADTNKQTYYDFPGPEARITYFCTFSNFSFAEKCFCQKSVSCFRKSFERTLIEIKYLFCLRPKCEALTQIKGGSFSQHISPSFPLPYTARIFPDTKEINSGFFLLPRSTHF